MERVGPDALVWAGKRQLAWGFVRRMRRILKIVNLSEPGRRGRLPLREPFDSVDAVWQAAPFDFFPESHAIALGDAP